MNFRALAWSKAIAYIAGGGLGGVFIFLALVWKTQSPILLAAGGACIAAAGLLNTLVPSPAKAITPDMPVIGKDGTANGALNVTTTSTPPIVAVTKGTL